MVEAALDDAARDGRGEQVRRGLAASESGAKVTRRDVDRRNLEQLHPVGTPECAQHLK